MKRIKGIEKIIRVHPTWKTLDLAFIKSLEWDNDNLKIRLYSQLRNKGVNWPNMSKDFFEVYIEFRTVSDLNLGFTGLGLQQVAGFDIVDVSQNGLEGINFQIEDYENGIIRFNCEEIEILEISQLFTLGNVIN